MSKQLRIAGDPGTLKPIIEALIFASEEPLPARTLVRIITGDEIWGLPAAGEGPEGAAGQEQLPLTPESSGIESGAVSTGKADVPAAEVGDDPELSADTTIQEDASAGDETGTAGESVESVEEIEEPGGEDREGDEIAGERIDLAMAVTTTSQLVTTADDVVEDAAVQGPDVADTGELVETPEEASARAAGEPELDEADTSATIPPVIDEDDDGEREASADAASGGNTDEAGPDSGETGTPSGEGDDAGAPDVADVPTEADLLATTDPVTLDAEPPIDLTEAAAEGAAGTVAGTTDEEPEALLEAMARAEARVSGRTSESFAGDSIDQRYVRILIEELNQEYDETGRAFRIVEVAGGFQFATTRDFGEYVALLSKEKMRRRLSPAALETLAIIAYRQPVSKPEIEAIRGVNCDQVLLNLMEKNLIAITGRSEGVGRPLLYGTTDEFLRIFGLNNVGDLPKLRELEELMEENVLSPERAEVVTVDENSDVEEIEAKVGAAGHHDDAQLPIDEFVPQPLSSEGAASEEDVQSDIQQDAEVANDAVSETADEIVGEQADIASDEPVDEQADAASGETVDEQAGIASDEPVDEQADITSDEPVDEQANAASGEPVDETTGTVSDEPAGEAGTEDEAMEGTESAEEPAGEENGRDGDDA